MKLRFTQIEILQNSKDMNPAIFALDSDGRVWCSSMNVFKDADPWKVYGNQDEIEMGEE